MDVPETFPTQIYPTLMTGKWLRLLGERLELKESRMLANPSVGQLGPGVVIRDSQ